MKDIISIVDQNTTQRPPGISARDIGHDPEIIPASKWGVYLDGHVELRSHLSRIVPNIQRWRGCEGNTDPITI